MFGKYVIKKHTDLIETESSNGVLLLVNDSDGIMELHVGGSLVVSEGVGLGVLRADRVRSPPREHRAYEQILYINGLNGQWTN